MLLLFVETGLQERASRVHRDTGTNVEHDPRLLAHGVAGARTCRRHDHAPAREEPGQSVCTGRHLPGYVTEL